MLRRALLPILLTACGPDSGEPTTTGGETSTTDASPPVTTTSGDAPTVTTEVPDPGTSAAITSDTGDTSTGPVDPTTGDATTGTSTGDGSSSGSETGDADVEYAAFFFAGGLDHIMIHKADATNDRCTTLHLAWPGGGTPELAITVPDMFAAQNAQVSEGVADCLAGMPMGEAVPALSGSGAVDWTKGPQEYCPLQLDVDVTLEFAQDLPWVPAQELLQAAAIPVQNCP